MNPINNARKSSTTSSTRFNEVVVGFKEEAEAIIEELRRGSAHLQIIAIAGMAGQGKTTLAKKVYNDPSIQSFFHKYAWCTVTQAYEKTKLLLDILSLVRNNPNDGDILMYQEILDELDEQLYKCLKGRRYLIVMDDIWDIGAWDELKKSFPDDNNGSRILFTTRIQNIVGSRAILGCKVHRLRPFSDEESWELMKKKLFHNRNINHFPPQFSEICTHIVRICKGLPLSVVVVAGLLAGDIENLDWWRQTVENLGSRIATEGCMDILELSYKHLPEFLKPCFLYFGAFQEDKVIRAQKLKKLWISEGFVNTPRDDHQRTGGLLLAAAAEKNFICLEDVARTYLEDLVARSLVIVTQRGSNGGIKACQVHDLLRDFCIAKGEKGNFFQVLRSRNSKIYDYSSYFFTSSAPPYPLHVKYQDSSRLCIQSNCTSFLGSDPSGPRVNSLLFSPTSSSTYHNKPYLDLRHFYFTKFQLLVVLDLEEIELLSSFPREITSSLLLLHYLALWIRDIWIPPSIGNLSNLETLRIRRIEFAIRLPDTIWKMKKLRHLDVGRNYSRLISRNYYDDQLDSKSANSSQLDNVQTFASPTLSHGEEAEMLLRRIPNVRKLKCYYNDDSRADQFPVLDFLSKLELLNVSYYGGSLQCSNSFAFNFPSTLRKLTLRFFRLKWTEISRIGKLLNNLEVLKLLSDAFDGVRWDMMEDGEEEHFSNLKFLKLSNLNIRKWDLSDDNPFPSLERLVVERCYNLEEIPMQFRDVLTLKVIEVRRCSSQAASSAMRIREEQLDMGNEDLQIIIGS